MDILKAFSLLDAEYQINIQGTLEDPLFQANQIGKLLGISNIRENLRDFSDDEKGVSLTDTLTGLKETNFLMEKNKKYTKVNHNLIKSERRANKRTDKRAITGEEDKYI